MLVLKRKPHEGVVFDGPGRVVVVGIRASSVQLGFECDPAVKVFRDELVEEDRKAAKAANGGGL